MNEALPDRAVREARVVFDALPGQRPLDVGADGGVARLAQNVPHGMPQHLVERDLEQVRVGAVGKDVALPAVNAGDQGRDVVGEGLQLPLALAQDVLGLTALGDVARDAEGAGDVAPGVTVDALGRQVGAMRPADKVGVLVRLPRAPAQDAPVVLLGAPRGVRGEQSGVVPPEDLGDGPAEDLRARPVDQAIAPVQVFGEDGVGDPVHDGLEQPLTLPEGGLGPSALGHVHQDAIPGDVAVGAPGGAGRRLQPLLLSRSRDNAALPAPGLQGLRRDHHHPLELGAVFGGGRAEHQLRVGTDILGRDSEQFPAPLADEREAGRAVGAEHELVDDAGDVRRDPLEARLALAQGGLGVVAARRGPVGPHRPVSGTAMTGLSRFKHEVRLPRDVLERVDARRLWNGPIFGRFGSDSQGDGWRPPPKTGGGPWNHHLALGARSGRGWASRYSS